MDADKIKQFFIHHCEKMILVVVIAASGFLVYLGLQLPDFIAETHQPDRLGSEATQVKSEIDEDHNAQIIPPRIPTVDFVKRVTDLYNPVAPSGYEQVQPWEGDVEQAIVRRQDPMLPPPRALLMRRVATSIAIRGSVSDSEDYLLAALEGADPVEMVEQPKVRERRPRRRRGGGGEDMDDMMDMEEEMMDEMDEDFGMMGMEASMSGGTTRKFNSKFDFGVRPTATQDKRNPKPFVGWFIAGTAVVPHKQLYEAYEFALRDANQYDPLRRDTPMYFNIEVQRADVTDKTVDKLAEENWVKIWDRRLYTLLASKVWSGFAPEIVPADYRDDALTMWIPPVLLDDYRTFAVHPLVPMISQQELKKQSDLDVGPQVFGVWNPEDEAKEQLVRPGGRPGAGGGMEMEMDMMMDMEDMDMGMGMGGMGMMGMGMAMFGRGGIEKDPVDYKLIRFYDFAGYNKTQYGRQYVYRLRYSVNDPNFPFSPMLQPTIGNLGPEVANRVQAKMAEALQTRKRSFQRWSDWSEPSEPTSLPSLEQVFAGAVNPGTVNVWQVDGKQIEYARDPPSAKIIVSQYDRTTGARIPISLDIFEGSVLSHKAESADVVDPISLKVLKMPDVDLVSGTTVVDLDGGKPLWKAAEGLTQPGLMLLYDQDGQLKVTDEVDDQEFYRIYSYAEERGEL